MTPKLVWFVNIKYINSGKVLIGNDESCDVTIIENVKFKMSYGSIKILDNVKLVPKLRVTIFLWLYI